MVDVRNLGAVVTLILALSPLGADHLGATPPPAQGKQEGRAEAWLKDLDMLATCLADKHKNAFFKIKREQFEEMIAKVRESIPNLKDHEILVEFMKLGAMIGDGHTAVYPGQGSINFRQYPIGLVWLKDGLYIGAVAVDHKDLMGARIIKVGKSPVDEAVERISLLAAAENESARKDKSRRWLAVAEPLAALGLLEDAEKGRFTLIDAGGKEREIELAPLAIGAKVKFLNANDGIKKDVPISRRLQRTRYGHEWVQDGKSLYCWYDSCADLPDRPVSAWCKDVLADIDGNLPERLILDLRRNGGGNSALINPLLKGIKDRPALNEKGRLFVLIGASTYSSALMNAHQFRTTTKAVLIGSPTGGSPNEYGEVKFVTLPHSKWTVQYSTRYFKMTNDGANTLNPDLEVICPAADYFAGGDPILDAAVNYKTG